jgi:RNA-binding protein
MLTLTAKQRKRFRAIGHTLGPVVTIAGNGLSESVKQEVNRALSDHELIKIKVIADNRVERKAIIARLTSDNEALLVQSIGSIALVYRPAPKPNPALSNILRSNIF